VRLETEAKVRIPPHLKRDLEEKLKSFELLAEEAHLDVYFNAPDRDFSSTDEALRLREVNGEIILTYKGPKISSNLKARKEIELKVSDFQSAKELLEALGYTEVLTIKKRRKVYRRGDAILCFDEVEGLNTFIEVEVLEKDLKKAEEKIGEILRELGLSNEPVITESYLELLLKFK